ncbi:MAG: hypothetical protein ABI054_13270 [Planctomycetota bacterium]
MSEPRVMGWKGLDLCICAGFLLFLIAPAIDFALHHDRTPGEMLENRSAAEFPRSPRSTLDWAGWPRAFEAWHDDHFGLRNTLVRSHNRLMIFGLGSSPSQRVLIGREHWIFVTGPGVDLWRGNDPFTQAELEAWRRALESRQRELAKRGIEYVFVLAPSKSEIYPEFLPPQIRKGGPSRTDQLVAHLQEHSSFRILDLRGALLEEKRKDSGDDWTFFPLGTHWTDRGAAAGTRAIARELGKLRPEVAGVDDTIEELVLSEGAGDSWAGRLYMPDLLKQTVRSVRFRESTPRTLTIARAEAARQATADQADPSLPRALVLHDSFGEPLVGMLGRHFSHSVFIWNPEIDLDLIEREKPDFVIHVFNDRVLSTLQPQEFNAADGSRAREQFEASRDVVLQLDAARNLPEIRAFGEATIALRSEGATTRVACKQNSAAGGFLLPEVRLRAGMHPILRLEFESPISSTASVLYQTRSDLNFSRKRQLHYEIRQGTNLLFVEILEPELAGAILLRPANEPGTFLVSGLEARLVPD